jgi:hypothetical protein
VAGCGQEPYDLLKGDVTTCTSGCLRCGSCGAGDALAGRPGSVLQLGRRGGEDGVLVTALTSSKMRKDAAVPLRASLDVPGRLAPVRLACRRGRGLSMADPADIGYSCATAGSGGPGAQA